MSLAWVDPELEKAPAKELKFDLTPQTHATCKNCGRESEWKDVYFDYCKHCVREAHQ